MQKLLYVGSKLLIAFLLLATIACSRPIDNKNGNSSLVIHVPKTSHFSKGVSAMSDPIVGTPCYAINLTGPGIDSRRANQCSPVMGRIAGYAGPGGTLTIADVPAGTGRKVQLFMYLTATTCPATFDKSFNDAEIADTHLVATANNIDMTAPNVEVTMTVDYDDSTNVAQQLGLPTCTTVAASNPSFSLNTAEGESSHVSGLNLKAKIGLPAGGPTLSGGGITLKVK